VISQIIFQKTPALKLIVIVSVVLTAQCQAMERDNSHELSSMICTQPQYSFNNPAIAKIEDEEERKFARSVRTVQMVAWQGNSLLISSPLPISPHLLPGHSKEVGCLTVINPETQKTIWSEDGNFYDVSLGGQGLEVAGTRVFGYSKRSYHSSVLPEASVYAIKSGNQIMSKRSSQYAYPCTIGWLSRDTVSISDTELSILNLQTMENRVFAGHKTYKTGSLVVPRRGGSSEITLGYNDKIEMIDIATGKSKKTISLKSDDQVVMNLDWNPEGSKLFVLFCLRIMAASKIGSLFVYSSRDSFTKPFVVNDRDIAVAVWLDNDHIVTAKGKQIYLQNANDGKVVKTFQKKGDDEDICDVCINSPGTKIASATKNSVDIWPIDDEKSTEE